MTRWIKLSLVLFFMLALVAVLPWAQAAGDLSIPFGSIDTGGGTSQGGNFSLTGTVGQADAGGMRGGNYLLAGGFWQGKEPLPPLPVSTQSIYLPLIVH